MLIGNKSLMYVVMRESKGKTHITAAYLTLRLKKKILLWVTAVAHLLYVRFSSGKLLENSFKHCLRCYMT